MSERLFGTDGVRGRAGAGVLAPDSATALGRAIGAELSLRSASGEPRRALVGHDGRRSGRTLETALAQGLAQGGFRVTSAGLITTPGLAWLGRELGFATTVMISASHNPASDNGIKVFDAKGEKLADAVEDAIEATYRARPSAQAGGPAAELDATLEDAYLGHLIDSAGGLDLSGLAIAVDCANGAASCVAPRVLGRLGARVLSIACEPDGDNINEGCGSTHPRKLQDALRAARADMGIALDGDGDRCILVDEHGALVHGDGILTLMGRHLQSVGRLAGERVVATVMSNRGLHRALREVGVDVVSVGVGDRRVVEALKKERLSLGGEQSGHIVFGNENHYLGDGMFTALRVLSVMVSARAPLSALAAPYVPVPQVLLNVPVKRKPRFADVPGLSELVRSIEAVLGQDGRVLLRYSGTESLARVMVEGPDDAWIRERAHALAATIEREMGI